MTGSSGAPKWRATAARLFPAALLLAFVAVGACRPADQDTGDLDPRGAQTRAQLPPDLLAALDSGSQAYRAGAMDAALEQYRRATELAPDHAAGWFGVYMVHHRRGEAEEAEDALARARAAAPGATIIHPTRADTIPQPRP